MYTCQSYDVYIISCVITIKAYVLLAVIMHTIHKKCLALHNIKIFACNYMTYIYLDNEDTIAELL